MLLLLLLLQKGLLHENLLDRGSQPIVGLPGADGVVDVTEASVRLGTRGLGSHVLDKGVGSGGGLG